MLTGIELRDQEQHMEIVQVVFNTPHSNSEELHYEFEFRSEDSFYPYKNYNIVEL